jgi:hypothetical protein
MGFEEARTLWIDFDSQECRHKEWREVCNESTQQAFPDSPLADTGLLIALASCKRMQRFGGLPSIWLANFCRDKGISPHDRNYHEIKNLVDAVEAGGCYDQCNVGGLVMFEILLRRIAAMAAALSRGAESPNWNLARDIQGQQDPYSLLSPEKQEEVNTSATKRLQVEALRARIAGKGYDPTAASSNDVLAGLETGGLPGGGKGGVAASSTGASTKATKAAAKAAKAAGRGAAGRG